MQRPKSVISFRIDSELAAQLDRERKATGFSRGDFVRGVLIARLFHEDEADRHALLDQIQLSIERLGAQLAERRKRDARIVFALLTQVGDMSPEEAKALIRRAFDI